MENYPPLLRTLLEKRGIKTAEEAEIFLRPDYERDLHDPFLMRDMEHAVVRVFEAVGAREKIAIYADYDCDGIPGAVILNDFFKEINYDNFSVYIPDRDREGYGLKMEAVEKLAEWGVNLIITVDLGINAVKEIAQAEALGIDVIVTDHHLPSAEIPRACAILNPQQPDCQYPFKWLCGAGVVFKLIQGMVRKYGEYYEIKNGWEKWLLDMVGLATLSDMVPLLGENRALAHFGLKVLHKTRRLALKKLYRSLNLNPEYISEEDLSFSIVPKLNAASRMAEPMIAFKFLTTSGENEAKELVNHLIEINDQRKILMAKIMREVRGSLRKVEEKKVIVIGNPKWRVGILGLVSNKLVEEFSRPAFVWGVDGSETIKGSCRSDGSVNLVEMMREVKAKTLTDFGGHELAGGFSVDYERVHFLEEELIEAYEKTRRDVKNLGNIENSEIDKEMPLNEVTMENYGQIEKLAPFGEGNPRPVFLFEEVEIDQIRKFGKDNNHLELSFIGGGGRKIKAISFFSGEGKFRFPLGEGNKINLVASFDMSHWNGNQNLRLRVVDII